ncbi:MAG: hypothetical protein RLZZ237_3631, partial [Pseudomonadota bacterium]
GAMLATLAVWGAAYGTLPVLLQTMVFKHASKIEGGADAATSINVAVFNAAIGLGAWIGGLIINSTGAAPIPGVSACFILAGLIVVIAGRQRTSRHD